MAMEAVNVVNDKLELITGFFLFFDSSLSYFNNEVCLECGILIYGCWMGTCEAKAQV